MIFLFILGTIIAIRLIGLIFLQKEEHKPRMNSCPPHKYEYRDQPGMSGTQYMICKECNMNPYNSFHGRE